MEKYLSFMNDHHAEFMQIRRDIHQHPELGYDEHRTSNIVKKLLSQWGYEVFDGYAVTGVVGVLKKGQGKRRIGIRADMDALPIQETTKLPYASVHESIMHACGHDGHTTMLLAAAKYLAEQGDFSGTLNLIFQPAEESLGGALRMINDGLFENHPCDAVFALHNSPGYAQGRLLFKEGEAMASSDYVTIKLTGAGGHGAYPQRCQDPIVAAASIIMALQTVVSRNAPPSEMAVVTVGSIHAGKANNVIPETAELSLSVRTLNRDVRHLLEKRIKDLVAAQAQSFEVHADILYERGYPVLVNSKAETDFARSAAAEFVGGHHLLGDTPARCGSEDFAFMLERVPGCYFFIGNGDGNEVGSSAVHTSNYDFNDKNLPIGGAYWSYLTEKYLTD